MLWHYSTGAQCENGVCGCANTYTYVRGRCRQLVNLNEACRDVSFWRNYKSYNFDR